MQQWQLDALGVGTFSPSQQQQQVRTPPSLQSPSGTATPQALEEDEAPRTSHHLRHLEPAAPAAHKLASLRSRGGETGESPSAALSRVVSYADHDDDDALRSPPRALPGGPKSASERSDRGSSAAGGGEWASQLNSLAIGDSGRGDTRPTSSFRRAAESVRLATAHSPFAHPRGAGLAASPTSSPIDGCKNPSHNGGASPASRGTPHHPASPYSRHAQIARRVQAHPELRDAFLRGSEQRAWAELEGPPQTRAEMAEREAAALEVRRVQDRSKDFLHNLETAASREASFRFKSDAQRLREVEAKAIADGRASDAFEASKHFGVATGILTRHRAEAVEAQAIEESMAMLDRSQRQLLASPKGTPKSVLAAGTSRADAEPPLLFSFDLTEAEKHVIMCTLNFAVSHDLIANDAEFRSRIGWYRGDVRTQIAKLSDSFASWSCVCYTRGVTWNMVHNCFTHARLPVAWTNKPTSRGAYFGRVSHAQVESLHDRLLADFSLQMDEWRAGGRDAARVLRVQRFAAGSPRHAGGDDNVVSPHQPR